MKRILILCFILIIGLQSCKKDDQKQAEEAVLAQKYARFNVNVYKDTDLKQWLATLAKAEYVDLLDVLNVTIKNKTIEIAKIKLTDDSVGYIKMEYLADRPVVFLEETKAFVRNNISSRVYMTIPRGTIAFIIDEKGEWLQIYAGQIQGKWLTRQWVNSGFSTEEKLILQARAYEEATETLKDPSGKTSDEAKEQALQKLRDLASNSAMFGDMAREALSSHGEDVTVTGDSSQQFQEDATSTKDDFETSEEER